MASRRARSSSRMPRASESLGTPPPPYPNMDTLDPLDNSWDDTETYFETRSRYEAPSEAATATSRRRKGSRRYAARTRSHSRVRDDKKRQHHGFKNTLVDGIIGAMVGSLIGYIVAKRNHQKPLDLAI